MPSGPDPAGTPMLITAARTLAVDAIAAELCDQLRQAGVDAILLKGATLADWLYGGDAVRSYGDVDLLVDPARVGEAERLLAAMGFETGRGRAPAETPHARPWRRAADGAVVDLHWTISGSCLGPQATWAVLSEHAQPLLLGGGEVRGLDRTASALLVVLHASQHGEGKPLLDLQRALARLSPEEWRAVATLAERLRAEFGLSDGLRLLAGGRQVAEALELPPPALFDASTSPRATLVLGLDRLARTRGLHRRLWLLVREAFPEPDFMRWRFPLARRGRRGLATAYVWRLAWLLWHAGPSLRAWRLSRRGA